MRIRKSQVTYHSRSRRRSRKFEVRVVGYREKTIKKKGNNDGIGNFNDEVSNVEGESFTSVSAFLLVVPFFFFSS
jgi:hypothetical protein